MASSRFKRGKAGWQKHGLIDGGRGEACLGERSGKGGKGRGKKRKGRRWKGKRGRKKNGRRRVK